MKCHLGISLPVFATLIDAALHIDTNGWSWNEGICFLITLNLGLVCSSEFGPDMNCWLDASAYWNIIKLCREVWFSPLPWARTFVGAALAKNHGTTGCRPKTENRILRWTQTCIEMRYQQQMHLKEDRWSSPSASFHAATERALTSGHRLLSACEQYEFGHKETK